jgi:hypothetical protein
VDELVEADHDEEPVATTINIDPTLIVIWSEEPQLPINPTCDPVSHEVEKGVEEEEHHSPISNAHVDGSPDKQTYRVSCYMARQSVIVLALVQCHPIGLQKKIN